MSQDRVREILAKCAQTGVDPVVLLDRMKLLWDDRHVVQVRQDTLRAASAYFNDMSLQAMPISAVMSPLDMRNYIVRELLDLAERQAHGNGNQEAQA